MYRFLLSPLSRLHVSPFLNEGGGMLVEQHVLDRGVHFWASALQLPLLLHQHEDLECRIGLERVSLELFNIKQRDVEGGRAGRQ